MDSVSSPQDPHHGSPRAQFDPDFTERWFRYEDRRTERPADFPIFPPIPSARYVSPEFAKLENDHLWPTTWLLVGHEDEISSPGQYKTLSVGTEPIFLVRTRAGGVNAFYNVCTHRSAILLRKETGATRVLACGYHGWIFDDQGNVVSVPQARDFSGMDLSCRSLKPVRCEQLGKLIFINLDPDAAPLAEYLGEMTSNWDQFQLDHLRLVKHSTMTVEANWKIALESMLESYHAQMLHKQTTPPYFVHTNTSFTMFRGGHGQDIMESRGEKAYLDSIGFVDDRPDIGTVGPVPAGNLVMASWFPNTFIGKLDQKSTQFMTFWPEGNSRCRISCYWLGADWGQGEMPSTWTAIFDEFDRIIGEDLEMCTLVQRGMMSKGARPPLLGYREARIYNLHQTIDSTIGRNRIPNELSVEPVITEQWLYPKSYEKLDKLF